VLELTPAGALVQAFPIAFPRGSDTSGSSPGGVAVASDGSVEIFDGVFNAYLASLSPVTGNVTYNQGVGFGGVGVSGSASVATLGQYAYVTDQVSADSSDVGLVRFDLADSTSQRFFDGESDGTLDFGRISAGLDGFLYGTTDSGHAVKIDPLTMTVVDTISFSPYFVDQVTADSLGDIFMSGQGYIREFAPDGTLMKSIQVPFGAPQDMTIAPDGTIVVSSTGDVGLTNTSLSSISTFAVTGAGYVAIVVPEPSSLLLSLPPAVLLAGMRRRRVRFGR
jgi:streptogramin lyase